MVYLFVETVLFACFEHIIFSRILGGSARCYILFVFWNSGFI